MPIKDHDASYRTIKGVSYACLADRSPTVARAMAEQLRAWGYRARLAQMHDGSDMRRLFVEKEHVREICDRLEREGSHAWVG